MLGTDNIITVGTERYLEPNQTSTIKPFCENC